MRRTAALLLLPIMLPAQDLTDLPLLRLDRYAACTSRDPGGSNEDWGHYVEVLADGTRVLASFVGPGRLLRIWSADPQGEVALEVDGEVIFSGPFRALFDGSRPPFVQPLARSFAGGFVCHVEVPFAQKCRLLSPAGPKTFHQVAALLGPRPEPAALPAVQPPVAQRHRLRGSAELLRLDGPGELVELRLRLQPGEARRLWLSVAADGAAVPTLQGPVDLLLPDDLPTAATATDGGWRRLLLPMPWRRQLSVTVRHDGDGEAELELGYTLRPLPAGHQRGYLHASFARRSNRHGEPFAVLQLDGRHGHFVGLVAELCGAPAQALSFLEGDETVIADGVTVLQGTGTEDFFDGGWYFRGNPAGSPSAAVAAIDDRLCRVRAARFCLLDPVPFQQRFQFALEHGGGNDSAGSDYATLALWYDDDKEGVSPPPPGNALSPTAPPPPPQWVDVAAGEVFRDAAVRDGVVLLGRGEHRLPAAQAPTGYTLRRGGRAVAATVLAEAGAGAVVQLERDLEVDTVRLEPALPAIRDWRVLGPFAGGDRKGLDRQHGPERDRSETASYQVLGDGPGTWQALTVRSPSGVVDLDSAMGHRDDVVAFAATMVHSGRDQDVVLWLGSDDAVRAFVDGRLVHEHRGVRGCVRDQDRVPLHLQAGEHELLLEVEDYQGGFGCFARIDGDGLSYRAFRRR